MIIERQEDVTPAVLKELAKAQNPRFREIMGGTDDEKPMVQGELDQVHEQLGLVQNDGTARAVVRPSRCHPFLPGAARRGHARL